MSPLLCPLSSSLKRAALSFLLLACAACVPARPTVSPAAPTAAPTAALIPSPNATETEANCPLDPAQADLRDRLPRTYADGKCQLHFLPAADPAWTRAILTYPAGWRVSLANPQGTALLFDLAGRVFFVQFYRSDLPLERADEVGALIGDFVEPAVHPEEVVKERSLLEVAGKSVLLLSTTLSEQSVRRYFLKETFEGAATPIVMFQVTVAAPQLDNTILLPVIEEMIGTLQWEN